MFEDTCAEIVSLVRLLVFADASLIVTCPAWLSRYSEESNDTVAYDTSFTVTVIVSELVAVPSDTMTSNGYTPGP